MRRSWTETEDAELLRLRREGKPWSEIGARLHRTKEACEHHWPRLRERQTLTSVPVPSTARLPEPAPAAGGATLPDPRLPSSTQKRLTQVYLDNPGWWLIIGDAHIPMHDKRTIELAVKDARARGVVGVLINGDWMDCGGVSPFFRECPDEDDFILDLENGKQGLAWLRSQLPKARFVYREGNHEYRLTRYIVDNAPRLSKLPSLSWPALLGMADLGIEWVDGKRLIHVGKLPTLHGHELGRGYNPVNAARMAFLKSLSSIMVHHFHVRHLHGDRSLLDDEFAAYSVGCACFRYPDYAPYNKWHHGYAMVEVDAHGQYGVENRQVLKDGKVA